MKHFLFAALLLPTAAMAHQGQHDTLALSDALSHLVTQADHIALILAAFGVGYFFLRKVRR